MTYSLIAFMGIVSSSISCFFATLLDTKMNAIVLINYGQWQFTDNFGKREKFYTSIKFETC